MVMGFRDGNPPKHGPISLTHPHMEVSINMGPQNSIKMDDLGIWGYPYFRKPPYTKIRYTLPTPSTLPLRVTSPVRRSKVSPPAALEQMFLG